MPSLAPFIVAQIPAENGPGMLELFLQTGAMAKFVLGVLTVLSIVSWSIMVGKWVQFRRANRHGRQFLDVFRRSQRFSEVNAATSRLHSSPLVGLFQAGYVEIDAQVKAATASGGSGGYRIRSMEGLHRSLRRALGVERQVLSRGTSFLATTAAASPFIGLFGTVWGIMIAFRDIGFTGSTSLVTVAPGIAEALINTAAGLAAAIPALMGYNFFSHQIRSLAIEMEDFILEFLNLAERNFT